MTPRVQDSWAFWQKAEASLNAIQAEMQKLAPLVTQYPPIEVPRHVRAEIRRNVARFSEKFDLLVLEQRRAAHKGAKR